MAESLRGTILRFEYRQSCQSWRDKPNFYDPALAKTFLQGSSFDLYAPVEDSLNGLERLAGEPIVAYTTDPQRR